MSVKKPKSARTARRAAARAQQKLTEQRARLARLEPGGAADRPLEVDSASVVEARVEAVPCIFCGGRVRTLEHRAETFGERRLRVAAVRCVRCGADRTLYFRIGSPLPS